MTILEQQKMIPESYLNMSTQELIQRVTDAKEKLGDDLLLMSHHYQKDEIVAFADASGDSLQLAQLAAKNTRSKYIVFCGVHFMAETADMLTNKDQVVILPDLAAGCSMADMANHHQLKIAWEQLMDLFGETIMPVTYINSTAAVKAFVGEKNGVTVTSGNATKVLQWAFNQKSRIFFLPDQHLGRNTAVELGIPLEAMAVWNPVKQTLDYTGDLADIKVILWDGFCSVHQQFTVEQVEKLRQEYPDIKVIVHPECPHELVQVADDSGSTKKIIQAVEQSPAGSRWAIGTDHNLVGRIKAENPDKYIHYLNTKACPCLTMNRIRLPHLAWVLDSLIAGEIVNQIQVNSIVAVNALKPLAQMLELS